jgi:hypothetical protein
MADVRITALPTAQSPITGAELVPIVQDGLTVQTTVSAIISSPSLTQTFLTVGLQTGLPNSRYFSTGTGLGITDGGAQGAYTIALNGTSASLEGASAGVIVKTAPNTIAARTLGTSGNGISVSNGDGVSGNPTFQLTGLALALANATGTGLLALGSSTTVSPVTIVGTSDQIDVAGGDGTSTPTISLADNFIAPGTAGITLPNGTNAERGATQGQVRYNTTSNRFEGNYSTGWQTFGVGDGTLTSVSGTANQISVSTVGGIATVAIAANPVLPGTAAVQVPAGTTAQRSAGTPGLFRLNTDTNLFEGYNNTSWVSSVASISITPANGFAGTSSGGATPALTLSTSVTGIVKGNGTALTAATANTDYLIPALANTAVSGFKTITFNGQVSNAATSGAITIDWTTGNYQLQAAPTGTITYTFTAPVGVSHWQLFVAPAALAQMIIWPANLYFLGATWSGTNNKAAIINFYYDGTNYYAIGTNQV